MTGTYLIQEVDGKPVRVAPRPDVATGVSKSIKGAFLGRWRITEMEQWDQPTVDVSGLGQIEFRSDGTGEFRFIAVDGWMDCRFQKRDGRPLAEFLLARLR